MQCLRWFWLQYPKHTLFAIPNGGKRSVIEAGIMKAEGVLAGVADCFFMKANNIYNGLFIEIKTPKGKQTDTQKAFELRAKSECYDYKVCRSLDEFMQTINEYLKNDLQF
jgi:hypothetical protein